MPDQNPLLTGAPTWADAYDYNTNALSNWVTQQRQISSDRGLWNDQTGLPTGAGLVNAAGQYANALLMGTTAPGRPHFELDPYDLRPADNLTPHQQSAVNDYSHGSYYLNGDSPDAEALRSHMDAAIANSRLSDNARLYRGFTVPYEFVEQNLQPGKVVPLSTGFVSTSTSKKVASDFADDEIGGDARVMVELRIPRGHPALHVPTPPEIADPTRSSTGNQNEVLLPRNTQFRIHSVNETHNGNFEVLAVPAD